MRLLLTALPRILVVAEMQGRDLTRRRLALFLFVAVPVAFYSATIGTPSDSVFIGGIGTAFSIGGTALFAMLGSRRIDPRLVLAGYRQWEVLIGRLILLEGSALVLVSLFGVLFELTSHPARPGLMMLGLVLTALVTVPLALALGVLLPRELEGALAIIGLVGIEEALPLDSPVAPWLPLYGPARILVASNHHVELGYRTAPVLSAIAWALALFALAVVLWGRRVRGRGGTFSLPLRGRLRRAPDAARPLSRSEG